MFALLLLLFVIVPIVELWLLVRLSGVIGFWYTLGLILGTGLLGAALAKWQGAQAIRRIESQLRLGVLPAQALGDGALIFAAGVLLISPGTLSDIAGLLLLLPPVRKLTLIGLRHWLAKNVRVERQNFQAGPQGRSRVIDAKVIDARVIDPEVEES